MRCEEARPILSAGLDGEIGEDRRQEVERHLSGCAQCREAVAGIRDLRRRLGQIGREAVPVELEARIRARLVTEHTEARRPGIGRWFMPTLQSAGLRAAAVVLLALASALAGWQLGRLGTGTLAIEHDVLAAHVRSLLQASPIEVASSSTHSVKPWFTGRIEFAPPVKDLSIEGFTLIGGRVEYIGEKRVAALVYKRRLHVINVLMWPSAGKERTPAQAVALKGYNAVSWSSAGMTYWAISDLNAAELAELAVLY